ncbi:MAG: hypothetical protein KDD55_12670 [Bdellovibrionales bacterium]|nr:hypothetical protein [Bdellovibrionales bacterium]
MKRFTSNSIRILVNLAIFGLLVIAYLILGYSDTPAESGVLSDVSVPRILILGFLGGMLGSGVTTSIVQIVRRTIG